MYSLRLALLLASPYGHGQTYSCSGSLPLAVVAPLLFLFLCSLVQGRTLFAGYVKTPAFVSCSDKILIWVVFLCSFLCSAFHQGRTKAETSPARWLAAQTQALAYVSCPSRLLFQTEVASLQGGGLAMLPGLARSSWLCTFTFCKALVCLCVLCFLV